MKTLIQLIAKNCQWLKTVNENYRDVCESRLDKLEKELPSGSGIDCGCKLDREKSGDSKVIITFDYHYMNGDGYYDGWLSFKAVITPTLSGYQEIKITGRDKQGLKDMLFDTFSSCLLETLVDESAFYDESVFYN